MYAHTTTLYLACALAATASRAQTTVTETRATNLKTVEEAFGEARRAHAEDDSFFLRRGLVANRKTKRVTILAEASGLGPGDTVEFFLVAETSSHDYESLAVSFAEPRDLRAGLEHIGMTPGLPVNTEALRFWPKGERVVVRFARHQSGGAGDSGVRAERLVLNRDTGKTLREGGFVFTGSFKRQDTGDGGAPEAYAADVVDPKSIASNYNEPQTMLDVPRQAPQGTVYGKQVVQADHAFRAGELLEVTLGPEYPDGRKRVTELLLQAAPRAGDEARGLEGLVFHLRPKGDGSIVPLEGGTIENVLQRFSALQDEGRDPFVTLAIDDAVPVRAVKSLCGLLSSIDTETGIRVDPPPPGQLYYKAFLPDEGYRDREKRPSQPWELHLWPGPDSATGAVWQIEQVWKDDSVYPDLKTASYPVQSPAEFASVLKEKGPGIPVILVYAQPNLANGALMRYLTPVRGDYPVIFVLVAD